MIVQLNIWLIFINYVSIMSERSVIYFILQKFANNHSLQAGNTAAESRMSRVDGSLIASIMMWDDGCFGSISGRKSAMHPRNGAMIIGPY